MHTANIFTFVNYLFHAQLGLKNYGSYILYIFFVLSSDYGKMALRFLDDRLEVNPLLIVFSTLILNKVY